MDDKKKSIIINLISFIIIIGGTIISTVYYMLLTDKRAYTLDFIPFILLTLISYSLTLFISVLLHEFGHFVFGKLSGYDMIFFRIFSWTFIRIDGKIEVKKLSIQGTGGQCLMLPSDPDKDNYPFILYNMGGIILNALSAILAFILLFVIKSPEWSFILALFITISIMLIFTNALPFSTNDGANIKNLLNSPNARRIFYDSLVFEKDRILGDFDYRTHKFTGFSQDSIIITHIVDMYEIDKYIYEDDSDRVIELADRYLDKKPPMSFYQLAVKYEKNYALLDKLSRSDDPSDLALAKDLYKLDGDKSLKAHIKNTHFPSIIRRDILYYAHIDKNKDKLDKAINKFKKINENYYDKFIRREESKKVERILSRGI